ncbi:MAG: carbohydrate ABC transporter permease [Limnochordia bacterium]|jgi:multiple sugar transport system permease protein|nr:carbohydrate ABC transporter permease [Limnochordia bacterium]MDI9464957.1 carbohydrate ABC transporter permease [Bacillota bacterium]NLO96040.1 carbohydrate ABC transporter permease [Bacillota bacterium]HAN95184.1 carbohydrate ABC transporter permease [Bacillota bacterium]HOB40185.1 carbohydrate ABC transporter permease [Limnochordia bacterium]
MRLNKLLATGAKLVRFGLLVGIGFIILYPLLRQLSAAVMHPDDMYDLTVNWIPRQLTRLNFEVAWKMLDYPRALVNTVGVTVLLSTLELAATMIIGYGFARWRYPGSNLVFALVILSIVIPPQMVMVPLFLNFRYFDLFGLIPEPGLNLIGSFWPLVLMALTGTAKRSGLFIFITRNFFRGMSTSLEEAAYVDGAGHLRTFFQIMLPNAKPIAMIVFLFSFVWNWNDLFYTNLFLPGAKLLQLGLATINSQYNYPWANKAVEGTYIQLVNNAGMLLYVLPVLILYAFLQRYFIESIEKTGLVG